jgi:ADP-heptose:LPS heptosyltransferase
MMTAIGRVAKLGVSPGMLLIRAKALRMFGIIPKLRRKTDGEVQRIFFSFPYHQLGDFALALTLLDRAHAVWPNAEIDVAVGASFAPLVEQIPYVRRVFSILRPANASIRFGVYREFANLTRCYRAHIASQSYDIAISPRWDSTDSYFGAYLAYLTGAPVRCGYSGKNDGVRPSVDRLYTVSAIGGAFEHESLRYSRLLGRCGFEAADAVGEDVPLQKIQALWNVAQHRRSAAASLVSGAYAVLCPGALFLKKRWPIERFAAVGQHLQKQYGLQIVVVGSTSEMEICSSLCKMIGDGAVSFAGTTVWPDILELTDIIAGAEVFLGNDSGSSHIAGGVGVKTVVVNAFPSNCLEDIPNSPVRFRPVGTAVKVLQPEENLPPCTGLCTMNWQHCIQQVQIDNVCSAVDSLMATDRR